MDYGICSLYIYIKKLEYEHLVTWVSNNLFLIGYLLYIYIFLKKIWSITPMKLHGGYILGNEYESLDAFMKFFWGI